ncbi:uncharacterized protein K02A2.6-like [Anopheles funestus]|uniref:uncharacterized protein K02A2.6-like n=1 Tax=Anopheles funestus TaxID=62324 RepID=UPI0020C602AC|nr:uncharacterized protein K02A2.6-like [Anopheles funestus]
MDTERWPLEPFNDAANSADLRREWEEWHRALELIIGLKSIKTQEKKLTYMLARGGRGLQRIFYNLAPVQEEEKIQSVKIPFRPKETPVYDNAVKRLNNFFVGKRNERIELEIFRSLKQKGDETFNQFVLRIRTQAAKCDFQTRTAKEIFHQITIGAKDERVRDKGMENSMGIDELINYAINREVLMEQKRKNAESSGAETQIAHVRREGATYSRANACLRCGSWRHQANAKECTARQSRCNKCGTIGHFARVCKKRDYEGRENTRYQWKKPKEANVVYGNKENNWSNKNEREEEKQSDNGIITCFVDCLPVNFLIDSGAAINTVTPEVWRQLKQIKATIVQHEVDSDLRITAYATKQPLKLQGKFEAWVKVNEAKPKVYAQFFVVEQSGKCLLGKRTAEALRVLKVGLEVLQIDKTKKAFPKFPDIQVKLSIDKAVVPKKISYLRVPIALEEKVERKIQDMLDTDIIEPVKGPVDWISPMVVVPKGKDDIRICINMRGPNQAIHREHYPLPVIDTLLNKLRGSRLFSKLDITSAYHHVELHPASRDITAFMTNKGLMRFKRLMFGINCAPEIFQRIMCQMLVGIEGVVVYIDDIVVAGESKEQHDHRLKEVLEILKRNNATLNEEKCTYGVTCLEILGYNVSAEGIAPSEEKIVAIKNFRKPETKEEVRSFLGLINFVGQFIPDLSTKSEPLRKLIRGDTKTFGKDEEIAFDELRRELCNTVRRLGFFDPGDKTELYTDASPVGLGAVLVQRTHAGEARIISFASKGLTKTERIYPQTQREALAIVWAVEKFYYYLFGTQFTIFTDHKTLQYIFEGKHQNGRRACSRAEGWALRLLPYRYEVKHIPGPTNISDILSRLCPVAEDNPFDENTEHFLYAVGDEYVAITLPQIKESTAQDETLKKVMAAIKNQAWDPSLAHFQAFENELGILDGIVVRNDRIVLPANLRRHAMQIAHRGHPGVVSMKRNLRERLWWPYMDREVDSYVRECEGCTLVAPSGQAEPMIRKTMPERAWQDIAIDFFCAKEHATFLVIVDYYSRYMKIIEMSNTSATKTIEALEVVFKEQSYPETIRSDNGPPFSSEEFKGYCCKKNMRLIHTIPYWPQMNGLVERNNQGILRAWRIAKATGACWRTAIKEHEHMYNLTPHSTTGKAPLELLTGRPVKDLLPSLKADPSWNRDENEKDTDAIRKMKGKIYADNRRGSKVSEISEGDIVRIRNYVPGKLETRWSKERYEVIKKAGNDTIIVSEQGVRYRRPVAHLKKIEAPSTMHEPTNNCTAQNNNKEKVDVETAKAEGTNRVKRICKVPLKYR